MSDLVYSVEVAYFSSGRIDSGLNAAKSSSDKWLKDLTLGIGSVGQKLTGSFNNAFDSIASSAVSSLAGATATAGGMLAAGMGAAVVAGIKFNSEIEQAQIGLAAVFQSNGTSNGMIGGMLEAKEVVGRMRKDARELPGEFKDLVNIMSTIAAPAGHAGLNPKAIEELSAQTMSSAAVLHVPQATAAREMAMLLEGNARHSQPLALRLNLGDLKEFNNLDAHKRFEKIKTSLDALNPAIAYFSHSWEGIRTTAVDTIRGALGAVTAPLMGIVKSRLFDILNPKDGDQTRRRTEQFHAFAEKSSSYLLAVFYKGEQGIKHWFPIVKTFSENIYKGLHSAFSRISPHIEAIFGRIEKVMRDPKAFDQLAHAAKLLLAARVGSGVASAGFGLMSSMGGIGSALGGIGGAGGAAAGLAALGPIALAGAAAVAVLAVGAYGAVGVLTDSTSTFHEAAMAQAGAIMMNVEELGKNTDRLAKAAKPVTDIFGYVMITQLRNFTDIVTGIVGHFTNAAEGIQRIGNIFEGFAVKYGWLAGGGVRELLGLKKGEVPHLDRLWRDAPDRSDKENKLKPPNHTMHVHNVNIKVDGNEDPDRVAKKVLTRLYDIRRNPITSPHDMGMDIHYGRGY